MHKISVIIPIYNAELYLSQCLESVINQNYQNLEIILVNDGCTDSCPKICDEYAEKDNRIKVIHQQNGGLSDARNAGLRIATGDYISFVDNDDLLSVCFYERLMQVALENNADIVECGFEKFANGKEIDLSRNIIGSNVKIYNAVDALELLLRENFKQIVWNKLFRSTVLEGIIFPTGKMNEDEFWTYKIFGNSRTIVKISDCLYYYRQHDESMMGKSYGLSRLDGLQGLEERIGYMGENFPELENLAMRLFCTASMDHYINIENQPEIDPQKIFRKKIVENLKKYDRISIIQNSDWKAVFWYQLFTWAPGVYAKLRNLNEIRIRNKTN